MSKPANLKPDGDHCPASQSRLCLGMSEGAQAGGSVSVLLLSLFFVRKLGSRSSVQPWLTSGRVSGGGGGALDDASDDVRLWKLSHIRRTCQFIYSLVGYREVSVAGSVGVALLLRSLCDLKMVHLTAAVENAIVSRNPQSFRTALRDFLGFMVPVSALNALLNYAINELALCLRERLSVRLLTKYASNEAFYRVGLAFQGRGGRQGCDQVLTHDLEEFTDALAGLFSHTLKPTVDVIIFAERLWSTFGKEAPLALGAYMVVSGAVLSYMRSAAGQYATGEQALEGEYRHAVSRLHEHAEQVASFGGGGRELSGIRSYLSDLVSYVRSFAQFRGSMSVIDSVAGKYFLTYLGWLVLSEPFLDTSVGSKLHNNTSDERYWHFHTVSKMMVNLSSAIGALLLSGRDVVRCLGMTERICDFEELLDEMAAIHKQSEVAGARASAVLDRDPSTALQLTDVPLVTPHGEILVPALSMTISRGTCLLITGPNGSGKSSLMRLLAGLWTPTNGTLYRSAEAEMLQDSFYSAQRGVRCGAFDDGEVDGGGRKINPGMVYLPQKPYMPIGTLRDQLVYPSSCPDWTKTDSDEATSQRFFDAALLAILRRLQLEYLVEREGGLDAVADWSVVLSGGEKQRISIARLYYHRPTFALLDESTSAVHEEVEDSIYQGCLDIGITLLTVSHRRSLRKHHTLELRLDGSGGYQLLPI